MTRPRTGMSSAFTVSTRTRSWRPFGGTVTMRRRKVPLPAGSSRALTTQVPPCVAGVEVVERAPWAEATSAARATRSSSRVWPDEGPGSARSRT